MTVRYYRCVCGAFEPATASRCLACGARRERIVNKCGDVYEVDENGVEVLVPPEDVVQLELMP